MKQSFAQRAVKKAERLTFPPARQILTDAADDPDPDEINPFIFKQQLLELMQALKFGRIENLEIVSGEPVFNPAPRVVKEIRMGVQTLKIAAPCEDFALKAEVIEFFNHMADLGTATIESVEVRHGLPFRMIFESRDNRT